MTGRDLRATWPQALITFCTPIILFLVIRWLLIEPFVIPSGSMIPNLLVHDHIFVNKLAYGLRIPFGEGFLLDWGQPKRDDVVVFQFPENPEIFYVKRLIGLPGDEVQLKEGQLIINNEAISLNPTSTPETIVRKETDLDHSESYSYFQEGSSKKVVQYLNRAAANYGPMKVPEGQYFMMGDNRDESSDSRVWGFVPKRLLVGKAAFIWLSCGETLSTAQMICNPQAMRWNRLFMGVH